MLFGALFLITVDSCLYTVIVDCVWNMMAHAQKPDFVFRRNGRVHLNRRGRQFSWLLAAEVCASAVVMLDTPRSEVVWEYWLPAPLASFPFTSPPVRHRVPSGFKRTLQITILAGRLSQNTGLTMNTATPHPLIKVKTARWNNQCCFFQRWFLKWLLTS